MRSPDFERALSVVALSVVVEVPRRVARCLRDSWSSDRVLEDFCRPIAEILCGRFPLCESVRARRLLESVRARRLLESVRARRLLEPILAIGGVGSGSSL